VSILPVDRVRYDQNDEVIGVTTFYFTGLQVGFKWYSKLNDRLYDVFIRASREAQLNRKVITHKDLPSKVRGLFDAGTRENIEKMVRDGQFTRVRLE